LAVAPSGSGETDIVEMSAFSGATFLIITRGLFYPISRKQYKIVFSGVARRTVQGARWLQTTPGNGAEGTSEVTWQRA